MPAKKKTDDGPTFGLDKELMSYLGTINCMPVTTYDNPLRISSGSLVFDHILGGGLPRNRLTIFTGDTSTGKTTSAVVAAAKLINTPADWLNGGRVALFDTENTYDPAWGEKLHIRAPQTVGDPGLYLFQPETGENVGDAIIAMLKKKAFDMIILDSIAETAFAAELEGTMEDYSVGTAARKWSQFRRMMTRPLGVSNTVLLFINQISMKMVTNKYQSPESEYGGRALPYKAVIRVRFGSVERIPHEAEKPLIATLFKPKTIKNKTAQPGRKGEITVRNRDGVPWIDKVPEILSLGKELLVFTNRDGVKYTSGECFLDGQSVGDTAKTVQGRLYSDKEFRHQAEDGVREAIMALNKRPPMQPLGLNLETGEIEPDEPELELEDVPESALATEESFDASF